MGFERPKPPSRVVIVGAGPAGATLAWLLARRGIHVTLLERRSDFAREFRGEVLMPSGVEALEQMGLRAVLEDTPSHVQQEAGIYLNGREIFRETLRPEMFSGRPPIAISQPAFLEGVVRTAERSSRFTFERGVAVRSLTWEAGRVTGVTIRDRYRGDSTERTIAADLVVGADGRNSMVRKELGLSARSMSPPMDVLWCKLSCPEAWSGARGYFGRGHLLIAYRTWDDTLQLGWVILKGTFGNLRDRGVGSWIQEMANHVSPDLAVHLRRHGQNVRNPFLLESVSDRVDQWSRPGAVVIGDAAHAMSPVAGQGINIALRDAIVAANHLVPLLSKSVAPERLAQALDRIEVERLRELQRIQAMQALPPKVVLSRAWWGDPLRQFTGLVLRRQSVRARLAHLLSDFLYGVSNVQLNV